MNRLKQDLLDRLNRSGLDDTLIPGFVRSLANSLFFGPGMDLKRINERLRYLGWTDIELDYHTLQLAIKCLEEEGVRDLEYRSGSWYKNAFSH